MRIALDTSVLSCAEGANGATMRGKTLKLIQRLPPVRAREAVLSWRDAYVVLAASAEVECRLLLSEDLQEGFTWRGVTVTNTVAATPHLMLAGAADTDRRVNP